MQINPFNDARFCSSSLQHTGDFVVEEEAEVLQFPIDELTDLISRDPRLFCNLVKVGEAELDEACLNNIVQVRRPAESKPRAKSWRGFRASSGMRAEVAASTMESAGVEAAHQPD